MRERPKFAAPASKHGLLRDRFGNKFSNSMPWISALRGAARCRSIKQFGQPGNCPITGAAEAVDSAESLADSGAGTEPRCALLRIVLSAASSAPIKWPTVQQPDFTTKQQAGCHVMSLEGVRGAVAPFPAAKWAGCDFTLHRPSGRTFRGSRAQAVRGRLLEGSCRRLAGRRSLLAAAGQSQSDGDERIPQSGRSNP
jgi:hypothetical protein